MPLTPRPSGNFQNDAFQFILGGEGFEKGVYADVLGVPTIGYGYALAIKSNNVWSIKATLAADLTAVGISLTTAQLQTLNSIVQALNANNTAQATGLSNGLGDQVGTGGIRLITASEGRTLFDLELQRALDAVQGRFRQFLGTANGNALFASLQGSEEMVALVSMAYNGQGTIGPKLTAALHNGDRAEAWYQIRYETNPQGIHASRRYHESDQFSLYNVPGAATAEEARQVYRMLGAHRGSILAYEQSHTPPQNVQTLVAALTPARDRLITDLNAQRNLTLNPNDYLATNVYAAPSANNPATLNSIRRDAQGNEIASNDLLIGEGGRDTLIGGAGNDILIGGTGDDTLQGGAGNDVYVFAGPAGATSPEGEGRDTIVDSDGVGSIRIGNRLLSGVDARSFTHPVFRDRPAWRWTVEGKHYDFILVSGDLVNGGTLWIEGEGVGLGSQIAVENFHQGDLGLIFPTSPRVQLVPEYPGGQGPFADANYQPTTLSTTLNEGQSRTVTLALSLPATAGQRVRLSVSNLASTLRLVTGADILSFGANGTLEIELAAGQSTFVYSLLSQGDVDDDTTIALSATLLDAQGQQQGAASSLNIDFDAHNEIEGEPVTTNIIDRLDPNSVQGPRGSYPADFYGTVQNDLILTRSLIGGGGSQVAVDEQGGDDDLRGSDGADQLFGGSGNDSLYGGGYIDLLHGDLPDGSGNGDDLLAGGSGSDFLAGNGGNDQLWAAERGNQATAITDAEAQVSVAQRGDFLLGQDGDDFMVGSSGFDVLAGGNGQDVLVGGGGDDLLVGDQSYLVEGEIPIPLIDTGAFDWGWSIVRTQTTQPDGSVRYSFNITDTSPYTTITAIPANALLGAADTIYGGAGNDGIFAGYGDDFADGGAGDDGIFGGVGNDTLLGGDGVDMLVGGDSEDVSGKDFLDGGAGNDSIFGGHAADVLYGGSGNDYLYGDDANDALAGDDYINGEDGDDLIAGGAGADALYGGTGNDSMYGDFSNTAADRQGNDFMDGGAGNDLLVGEGGDDILIGGAGNDQLYGESSDTPVSAQGSDYLDGGLGNDVLVGGGRGDTLIGGEGDDQLFGDASDTPVDLQGDDYLDGGAGADILQGLGGDDTLIGGADADGLSGGEGNDYLDGGEGNDTLQGGAGDDVLRGGAGADVLLGGAGDDTYLFSADDLTVTGGFADAVIDSEGLNQLVFEGGFTLDNVTISSGSEAGSITLSSGTLGLIVQNALSGSIGSFAFADGSVVSASQLIGSQYDGNADQSSATDNAILIGGTRGDTIAALGNNATISGGSGNDLLSGGAGSTTYLFERGDGSDTVDDLSTFDQSGGTSSNTVSFGSGIELGDITLASETGSSLLTIALGSGDGIVLSDFTSSDVLSGPRTLDQFRFADGAILDWAQLVAARGITITNPDNLATIFGTNVNDLLLGSSSSESIDGGAGDDVLDGGGGNDMLSGGAGNDTYRFGIGSGTDSIDNNDLSATIDRLEIMDGLLPQDVEFFRAGDSLIMIATGGADQLTIANYFGTGALDEIRFLDGTAYTPANVPLTQPSPQPTQGDDLLLGTANDDVIDGLGGLDVIHGLDGNDELRASGGGGSLYGEGGNDTLYGGVDNDSLFGGAGTDALSGGENVDTLFGEAGDDVLSGGYGHDLLSGGAGGDSLFGDAGNDTLFGGDDDDVLSGGAGNDSLSGGSGADTLTDSEGVNQLFGEDGNDILTGSGTLGGGAGDDTVTGSVGRDVLRGDAGNDTLHGGGSGDELRGGAGNDELHSGAGEDEDPFVENADKLYGEDGDDTLYADSAAVLDGGAGNDTYVVNRSALSGDHRFVRISAADPSGTAIDVLRFGSGIGSADILVRGNGVSASFWIIDQTTGAWKNLVAVEAFQSLASVIDEVRFTDEPQTVWSVADIQARMRIGSDDGEQLGGSGIVRGNGGNDSLVGSSGSDDLDGGAGRDSLEGSAGDDVYRFGVGSGYDEIYDFAGVDRIQLGTGVLPANVTLVRTSTRNRLYSGSTITNDSLAVVLGGGQDQLLILAYYEAGGDKGIEEIRFEDGTVWDAAAIAARVVNQAGAANSVAGTAGNDTFLVDHQLDQISETSTGDIDQVNSSVSYTLPANVENLTLTGSLALRGVGNVSTNVITGNAAANELEAFGFTADTLVGGLGDDIYRVNNSIGIAAHIVVENAGEGYDTIEMGGVVGSAVALAENVERLVYRGGNANLQFTGNALDNVIDVAIQFQPTDIFTFTVDGGAGADVLIGAQGTQIYIVDNVGDVVRELEGSFLDVIRTSVSYALPGRVQRLVLTGTASISGTGNEYDNVLDSQQNLAANTLFGGSGNDTYIVGANDSVVENAGAGIDTVEVQFNYVLPDNVENVVVRDGDPVTITGNAGNNSFQRTGGIMTATFIGGNGDDTYFIGGPSANITVVENADEGVDTVVSERSYVLGANIENAVLNASGTIITGNSFDNILTVNGSGDIVIGGVGNDVLNFTVAGNTLRGGSGSDIYRISDGFFSSSVIQDTDPGQLQDAGIDVVEFTEGGSMPDRSDLVFARAANHTDLEMYVAGFDDAKLTFVNFLANGEAQDRIELFRFKDGTTLTPQHIIAGFTVTGTEGANLLTASATGSDLLGLGGADTLNGGAGNDVLDGGTGADTMSGGAGNDLYRVDDLNDVVIEAANAGTDTVESSISYVLAANLENLTLLGTADIDATGNAANNTLRGNTGNNVLSGGSGDDTYWVDNAGDRVVENPSAGFDTVHSALSWTLGADIENLVLIGTADIDGTGNVLNNQITGNFGNNVLDGGAGADSLAGGAGNDVYLVESAGDVVTENAGEGADRVQSSVTYTLGSNVEDLTLTGSAAINGTGNALDNVLTGNAGNNTLTGNAGNDTLDGGAGVDALSGGQGNDIYVVDNTGDTVTESSGQGTDAVRSSVTWTLGSNVEHLTLLGAANINGTGNTLANTLTGNSGNNTLDGGTGADTLIGGAGNDTYVVDNTADVVTENAAEGTDLVQSSITYTLAANVENLTLTGTAATNGTGNALANSITGNSGGNTLDGGAGADTLVGGAGNDTYVIDNTGDVITENASEGTDGVQSSITYTLGNNLENLTLTGTVAINATGNTLANTLTGNSGDNVLDGGAGADTLVGGAGNDTYVVDSTADVVTEAASAGTDLVQSSVTYTLGANVENLTLTGTTAINGTGNTLANVLTGNSANNTLDGGTGADTLIGGAGNDTYVVDNVGDAVTENAGEGTDLVQSSVTYTLATNVENLTLTGTAAINGTGNTLANTLTGNSGNNVLDGGAGADTLIGGAGNDTYVVDNTADVVTEAASAGTDLVQSSVTFTLATNVENLTLTGTTAIDGTGNTLANILTGNSANNLLNGGTGADTLIGGAGNDTYAIDNSGDVVTENASEGTDLVQSSITYTLGSNVENLLLTGTTAINGTGNTLDNFLTGNSANNTLTGNAGNDTLDGGAGTDTMVGGVGNDVYYVDVSADVTTENANEGIDTVNSAVTRTLAANIELLFLTGTTAINGTGNSLSNLLRGNAANNTLSGAAGIDILEGGAGNDTLSNTTNKSLLNGGAGTDTLTGTAANDLLIGGTGNDAITTGTGADIIVFNKGDGQDTVAVSTTRDNTLSLGGAVYADLLFRKNGNDLILNVGATDQITFTGYYASTANRSVNNLQVVLEGTSDYVAGSADTLRDNKIETFNFEGLVAAFDAARTANPNLTSWSLTNALLAQHLSGSDSAALGGDLAYRYNRFGSLSDISFTPALGILGATSFGSSAQTLQALSSLQDSSARLS